MRLIQRNRHQQRHRGPRIEIAEAEISADLHYPAQLREPPRPAAARRLGSRD